MLEQEAFIWNVGFYFVYFPSWLSSFNLFFFYLFIPKSNDAFYLCLSPLDPTVLRTSGSTFFIRANTRAWRCTTVRNVTMPPTLPWSSATTWRKITLILRIQTWPTYMQVKIFFSLYLRRLYLTKIMKESTTVLTIELSHQIRRIWLIGGRKGLSPGMDFGSWLALSVLITFTSAPALNIHKIPILNFKKMLIRSKI